MSSRPFLCKRNMYYHQQRCVDKIYSTKTQTKFHTTHQYVFSKLSPHLFYLGGDTPFYAFGYEIEDFYLTRKKTGRRYSRRVRISTSIFALFTPPIFSLHSFLTPRFTTQLNSLYTLHSSKYYTHVTFV